MSITEQAAYLKGLADGLGINKEEKEGKLLSAIIDLLGDMADEVEALGFDIAELEEGLDAVSEDLEDVEDVIFDDEYDDAPCGKCGKCGEFDEYDDEDAEDDYDDEYSEDDEEYDDEEPFDISVQCPACDTEFIVTEDDIAKGEVECPNCGELLEFEFDGYEEDEE